MIIDAEGGESDDGDLEVELFLNNDDSDDGVEDDDEGQAILTNLTQQLLGMLQALHKSKR